MPRKPLKYGFKIALRCDSIKGFVLATNNILLPLGVLPENSERLRFENAVFQIVTGDGEATSDLTQRKLGEEVKFGSAVRLIHVNTNTLVCENRRLRATKEKVNQKVMLAAADSDDARNSRWRVMPRYKVRAEGENILDRDHIVLQSLSGDTYLHVAPQADVTTDNYYEVNASTTQTGLTIQAYDTEGTDQNQRELRGGDSVQVFHREERAFLVGDKTEKCFLEPEQTTSSGGSTNLAMRAVDLAALQNSNSMFVIEFDDVFAGGLVQFGRRRMYRLKSLSTGLYLCVRQKKGHGGMEQGGGGGGGGVFTSSGSMVATTHGGGAGGDHHDNDDGEEDDIAIDDDMEVVLIADGTDPGTRLCFHQATDETSNHARNRSRVFIEFPLKKEGLWFTCGASIKDMSKKRRSSSAKLEMDHSRPKKEVACSTAASAKDGVELIRVPVEEFQELNSVLALIPPIRRLVDELNDGAVPTVQLVAQVRENISTLTKLCTTSGESDPLKREGTPNPKSQNRLMDQQIPQLCLSLVEAILRKGSFVDRENIQTMALIPESEKLLSPGTICLKYTDFLNLVRLCFRCVKLSCFFNTHNSIIISDSLPIILKYVEESYGALDALSSIFLDCPKLVDTPDDLSTVEQFTQLALKYRQDTSQYVRFLSILCVCNSIGITNSQAFISEAIFRELLKDEEAAKKKPVVEDGATTTATTATTPETNKTEEEKLEPLLMKLKVRNGKVYINTPEGSMRGSRNSRAMSPGKAPASPQTAGDLGAEDFVAELEFADFCNQDTELGTTASGGPRMSSRSSFVSSKSNAGNNYNTLAGFFVAQLELLTALCVGRNSDNIALALRVVPADAIMPIVQNEDIPPSVRSAFFDFFRVTHLDVPPLEDKVESSRSLMHVWEEGNNDDKSGTADGGPRGGGGGGGTLPTLPDDFQKIIDEMKAHLLIFFDHNKSMNPGDVPFNKCVLSAVMCATNIAKYGLLTPSEYVTWIKAIIPVLDGRDDKEITNVDERYTKRFGATWSRYKFDEDNQCMMEVKLASMEFISILAVFVISTKVLNQIHVFRHEEEIPHLSTILDFRHDSALDKKSADLVDELAEIKRRRENTNLLMAGFDFLKDGVSAGLGAVAAAGAMVGGALGLSGKAEDPVEYLNELVDTLLDNALYEHHPVVCNSLSLLATILNTHHAMLQPLDSVQILSSTQGVDYYEQVKPILAYLTRYTTSTIPRLEYPNITDAITNLCDNLLISPANIQPNSEKQGILKNMGAHVIVSTIIASLSSTSATKNLSVFVSKLLEPAYRFLTLMVFNSPEAALDIFPFMEKFVHHLPFHVGVQSLCARVFEDNLDLCSSVSDTLIQDIVYAIPRTQFDPAIAHILHMLIYQHGVVGTVQRNQASVLRFLLEAEDTAPGIIRCRDLYTGSSGRKLRDKYLQDEEFLLEFSKVQYHLEMLSCITHSCKGKDQTTIARRSDLRFAMFGSTSSLEDVLEVVTNRHLPFFYRSCYLKLFTELYLEERTLRLALIESKHFRKFLGLMQDDLLKLDAMLQEVCADPGGAGTGPDPIASAVNGENTLSSTGTGGTNNGSGSLKNRIVTSTEAFLEYIYCAVLPALKVVALMVADIGGTGGEDGGAEEGGLHDDLEALPEIKEKLNDLAELATTCLNVSLKNHPVQPKAESPVPETIDEPKKGWFSSFRSKTDASKKAKEAGYEAARQSLLVVPLRFRSSSDFFFAEYDSFVDAGAPGVCKMANIPFIPIGDMKVLKEVVSVMISANFKEGDPDTTETLTNIDLYKDPRLELEKANKDNQSDADTDDVRLFKKWKEFRKKFRESSEHVAPDTAFAESARVILRKGKVGHDTVRSMVRVLDSHHFSDQQRIVMIQCLRQIIIVEDEESTDASILIKDSVDLGIEDEGRRIELEKTLVSLEKDQEARQNILAGWQGEFSLPPKVVQMVSTDTKDLLIATLTVGCDLLRDGNNKVQSCIYNWSLDREDEDFFVQARQRLLATREQVRERKRTLKRAIPDKAKRREKIPDEIHERLNRRYNFDMPCKLLEMIQLLCEGHYLEMQNYLREQEDNQVSINALEPIISLLEMLIKCVDRTLFDLTVQCLNTLTETYQGPCFGNQEFIISQNIGETVSKLLGSPYGDISKEQLHDLRLAGVVLLGSLFEGHMNVPLVNTLIASLNLQTLQELMDETYWEWAEEHGEGKNQSMFGAGFDALASLGKGLLVGLGEENEFEDTLNLSTNIFMFLKASLDIQSLTIGRNEEGDNDHFSDKSGVPLKEAFRRSNSYRNLSQKVATIEIMRAGNVERAYFRRPSIAIKNLRKASKERVIDEVDRAGDNVRLTDFFDRSFNLIHEMEYYEDMRKTRGLSLIHKYSALFDDIALALSFVINIFLLFAVHEMNNTEFYIAEGDPLTAFKWLGIVQIVIQCLLFLNFFFGPCRIHLNECWMAWQDAKNDKAIKDSKMSLSIEPPKFEPNAEKNLFFAFKFLQSVFYIFTWYPFYERCMFVTCAFMGFYVQPLWYCLQPLQIIGKSPQLQNVVRSVTQNGRNLLLTGGLLLVIVFIFSIVAFYNFSGDFDPEMTGIGGNCESLARCTMILLVAGLKAGGGIGDVIRPPTFGPSNNSYGYVRSLYDFLFFLVLIVISLNLVFGIILDTFGELRERRDFVTEDQTSKCFICGLEQAEFDRMAQGGFEQHIEFEHHMWDYLFFMHYVQLKPADQHNGVEGYVAECMENHEPKFYPVAKAMVLQSLEELDHAGKNHGDGEAGHEDGGKKEEEGDGGGGGGGAMDGGGALTPSSSIVADAASVQSELSAMKNQIASLENLVKTLVKR